MIPSHPPSVSKHSQSFEERLKSSNLPPPGPSYYIARRTLWLKPTDHVREPVAPSSSRRKLETMLNTPNAATNDQVWKGGIEKVWKGLSSGVSLKKRLPMELVMKIIHCAWIQEQTWPMGGIAPEPDDVLPEDPPTEWLVGTKTTQSLESSFPTVLNSKSSSQTSGYILP